MNGAAHSITREQSGADASSVERYSPLLVRHFFIYLPSFFARARVRREEVEEKRRRRRGDYRPVPIAPIPICAEREADVYGCLKGREIKGVHSFLWKHRLRVDD